MPFDISLIPAAVTRYRRERDRYVKLADRVAEICREDVCEQNAIRAQVTFRAKTEKSFRGKLRRFSTRPDKNYSSVDEIFDAIGDLAAVRISAYQEQDCERLVEHLRAVFSGPAEGDEILVEPKNKKEPENNNFYRAIHVQAALSSEQLIGPYDNVDDISCEIQICTMIAHVWNEIEHDIGYKPEGEGPSEDEVYHLIQLGQLVRQGDHCITALMAAHDHQAKASNQDQNEDNADKPFIDVHDFVSRLREFANSAMPNFAANSGQLFELFRDLDKTTPRAVHELLRDFDPNAMKSKIEEFNEKLFSVGVDDLKLDPESSDLMLIAVLEKNGSNVLDVLKGRAGRGKGRPSRLHRIASRYASQ